MPAGPTFNAFRSSVEALNPFALPDLIGCPPVPPLNALHAPSFSRTTIDSSMDNSLLQMSCVHDSTRNRNRKTVCFCFVDLVILRMGEAQFTPPARSESPRPVHCLHSSLPESSLRFFRAKGRRGRLTAPG